MARARAAKSGTEARLDGPKGTSRSHRLVAAGNQDFFAILDPGEDFAEVEPDLADRGCFRVQPIDAQGVYGQDTKSLQGPLFASTR